MIDKPIYRRLLNVVGEAHGEVAVALVLEELSRIFEEFALEVQDLYDEDPENDDLSRGYWNASGWCESWAEEIANRYG